MKVKILRFLDKWVGSLIILFFKIFKRKKPIGSSEKTLFVKTWALGESVLTLPLIEEYSEQNPNTHIAVVCVSRNKAVYEYQPFIDEIIHFKPGNLWKIFTKFKNYDLAFDLEPYPKNATILSFWMAKRAIGFSHGVRALLYDWRVDYDDRQHVVKTYLDLLEPFGYEVEEPEELVPLKYTDKDEEKVEELVGSISSKKTLVGMTVSSAETSLYRRWPQRRFAQLADKLIEDYNCVVVFPDTAEEKDYVDGVIEKMDNGAFNFAGRTDLHELFCLIEKCELYISNDTGPMHVAAAQGVPTIGLFGPQLIERFAPYGENNIAIRNCLHKPYVNPHKGEFEKPPHFCMLKIKLGDVLRAVENLL